MSSGPEILASDWTPERAAVAERKRDVSRKSMTFWADVWRRFKQNKLALFGVGVIVILILLAVFGPMLSSTTYSDQNRDLALIPPFLDLYGLPGDNYVFVSSAIELYSVTRSGHLQGRIPVVEEDLFL